MREICLINRSIQHYAKRCSTCWKLVFYVSTEETAKWNHSYSSRILDVCSATIADISPIVLVTLRPTQFLLLYDLCLQLTAASWFLYNFICHALDQLSILRNGGGNDPKHKHFIVKTALKLLAPPFPLAIYIYIAQRRHFKVNRKNADHLPHSTII